MWARSGYYEKNYQKIKLKFNVFYTRTVTHNRDLTAEIFTRY
ncbi:hypothetical protein F960_00803 [Acinetobacter gerneri DSM 14967 = CIP 107464 = MTCC 9824]|uniref:Uncharacterized protein n=1 Tax=Acinetobacter gerneri DSM 14967 = CIP 107464 = MTCC 9824 TaxID=1120926 RepID=N8ZSW0_9GAMM|nr:hypothetical protein F960_00803 [Acinetobacter gerneri DSM 14967 = CIP 107464 = MTCC 9824]